MLAIAYADFNGDGLIDIVMAPAEGTEKGVSIRIYQGTRDEGFRNATSKIISGDVPTAVHARKALVADFNGDGFVNFSDFCVLANEWLKTGESLTTDLTEDNKINQRDLAEFCHQWLTTDH